VAEIIRTGIPRVKDDEDTLTPEQE